MAIYWQNFIKYRYLLKELVFNEIKLKYRRSVLGIVWSILQPLMMMIVLTLVFSSVFKSDIPHFAVYVLTGRIIWDLFSQSTIQSMNAIVDNASLIKKMYVPKYIFVLSKTISSLANVLFSIVALFLVILLTGVKLTPAILLLPLPILYTFLFATGLGLLLSAYNVFFRDLGYLYEVFLTAWMYFTALFYPVSIIPTELRFLLDFNPVYQMLKIFRDITMYGTVPGLEQHLICLLIGSVSLVIGLYAFNKKQDKFILYI
ncbi:ABC transporter permease [Paenibacillus sp. FSL W8-1187]|uniref:ABC transporter permease n=1 Tax=Paenibacillus sp. FSL W8-1187 TaxID=2975339 RepID=UPI0030DC6C77